MWPTLNLGAWTTRGWKKGIRIGSAKTDKIDAFIEYLGSSADEHSGAEAIGTDSKGGSVRLKMLEKHVLISASGDKQRAESLI